MKQKFIIILKWGALLGAGLSLINLLGFFAEKIQYAFGPVKDLLQVVAIVFCLYMAIKEIRDKQEDGLIKFSKAFLIGGGIVFIGYIVLVLYMLLHYSAIDKEGIARINQKNIQQTEEAIKKDTLKPSEKSAYLNSIRDLALKKSAQRALPDSIQQHVDSGIIILVATFKNKMELSNKTDSNFYLLSDFDKKADKLFLEAIRQTQMNPNSTVDSTSIAIMEEVRDTMNVHSVFAGRMAAAKEHIPQFTKASGAALITTLPILLYGLMLDIFVALFLYRKEKTICSRNGNDPANSEEGTEETAPENENTKEE